MSLRMTRWFAVPSCGKTVFSCDPNIQKAWMNFIFNDVPVSRVSKTMIICSLHFTVDLFLNKTQFDADFCSLFRRGNAAQSSSGGTR
ncbi:hypothetical protein PO909_017226 [Leuciscus waleckii]